MEVKRVLIIGAGASGLMAALSAARHGASVTVLEHMQEPGKKLLITGSGKCNFTNMLLKREAEGDSQAFRSEVIKHYHGDPDFAASAIAAFDAEAAIELFRELGIEPTFRRYPYDDGVYVYPSSMEAASVLRALLSECERLGVRLVAGCTPLRLMEAEGEELSSGRWGLDTDRGCLYADSVIFATGSNAAPRTGSDSSIYPLIKGLGHSQSPFLPALCGLRPRGGVPEELKGARAEALVSLHVYSDNDMMLYTSRGEVQLGAEAISGVCVMDLSRHAAIYLKRGYDVKLSLRLLPWLSDKELWSYIERCLSRSREEQALCGALPQKLSAYVVKRSNGEVEETYKLLSDLSFEITKTAGFDHCQCSSGGVSTLEVDEHSMESKLKRGIYFCGEMLDVDGCCGGYNLQFAWSTGYVAGRAAARCS